MYITVPLVSPSEKTPSLDRVSSVEESSEVEKAEEEEEPAPQEVEKVEEVTDSWEDVKDSWEDETEYRNKEEDAVDGADVTGEFLPCLCLYQTCLFGTQTYPVFIWICFNWKNRDKVHISLCSHNYQI